MDARTTKKLEGEIEKAIAQVILNDDLRQGTAARFDSRRGAGHNSKNA